MIKEHPDLNKALWVIFVLAFLPVKSYRAVGSLPMWLVACCYIVMVIAIAGICILNFRKLSPVILLILITLAIWMGYDIVNYALHPY